MVGALLDTNVVIDFLGGAPPAREELRRYDVKAISLITWIEVMVGVSGEQASQTEAFLQSFNLLPIDAPIARRAVSLRQTHRMKLPDAIIWASAQVHSLLLVTRNTKDFPADEPGVRIPYAL